MVKMLDTTVMGEEYMSVVSKAMVLADRRAVYQDGEAEIDILRREVDEMERQIERERWSIQKGGRGKAVKNEFEKETLTRLISQGAKERLYLLRKGEDLEEELREIEAGARMAPAMQREREAYGMHATQPHTSTGVVFL